MLADTFKFREASAIRDLACKLEEILRLTPRALQERPLSATAFLIHLGNIRQATARLSRTIEKLDTLLAPPAASSGLTGNGDSR